MVWRMTYDAIVIGGGAAGLSAGLTLARSRRSVLVLDGGEPRNAPADGVHGLLGREGIAPGELLATGRGEVRGYGGEVRPGRVVATRRDADALRVTLDDGEELAARRLLLATGLHDELPAVRGLRERFGRDVVHCPYCHGWEVRDRAIAVLGSGAFAAHQAGLFRNWSDDVTLVLHTAPEPSAEEAEGLAARGVAIVAGEAVALEADGLRMRDGELVPCEAVAVMPRFVARTAGLEGLGLRVVEHAMGVGEHIEVDATGLAAPGVWAAGNCADHIATVAGAADQGVRAAAQLNADLIGEDTRLALAATPRAG
jgi:thioredoxin reductase